MNTNCLKSATIVAGLLVSTGLFAQETPLKPFSPVSSYRTWSIGIHGGVTTPMVFYGRNDFTNWETEIGYGLYIKKQILPSFGLRADFFRTTVAGDNEKLWGNGGTPVGSNFAFSTDVHWSAGLGGEFTLANINWLFKRTTVQPYISAGAGVISFSPTVSATKGAAFTDYNSRDIHDLVVPIGMGLKFNLSRSVNLDLGYTMNFVDGDNFDGTYYGEQNDRFSYGHLGLEFALGNKSKPQLATHNPVAAMQYDYMAQDQALRDAVNADLASKLAAERAANATQLAQMQQNLQNLQRLLTDADGDGVSDYFDKCLGTAAGIKVDGSGCPLPEVKPVTNTQIIVTEEDRRVVAEAIRNLEFDFNKATIRPSSFPSLDRVAELLITKNFSLKLAGHTDSKGSDAYNLKLSKDRAESVKQYLVSKGANPSRIEATGYGESQPIATNNTDAGRQKNRRVEFTLY